MERYFLRSKPRNDAEATLERRLLEREKRFGMKIQEADVNISTILDLVEERKLLTELRLYGPDRASLDSLAQAAEGFKRVKTRVDPKLTSIHAAVTISRALGFKLRYLKCFSTEDWTGADEAYLKIRYTSPNGVGQAEQRGVYSLNDGEIEWIEDVFEYQDSDGIRITLYEADSPDADDEIDSHKWYTIDTTWRYKDFRGDGAHYEIGYFGT